MDSHFPDVILHFRKTFLPLRRRFAKLKYLLRSDKWRSAPVRKDKVNKNDKNNKAINNTMLFVCDGSSQANYTMSLVCDEPSRTNYTMLLACDEPSRANYTMSLVCDEPSQANAHCESASSPELLIY
jgi:hypothetical protein